MRPKRPLKKEERRGKKERGEKRRGGGVERK
jgi:hypothetical protein